VHIDDERLYLLLDRYLAGEASAAEAQAVREWLAEDAEHELLLEELRFVRRAGTEKVPPSSTDMAWARAVQALELAPKPRVSRRLLVAGLTAAAVVVALLAGRIVLRPRWSEYAAAAGHRTTLHLPDGTRVTLGPKSRLRNRADYGRSDRAVYLDGEAYFQVAPDKQRPFRVHTAGSVTEDLGTAFVVSAYTDQIATEVIVTEGRVSLSRADTTVASRAVVLEARDLGRLDSSGTATVRRGVDVDRYLAWTKGVLAFDGAPLSDVVRALGRWYNVEMRLPDSAVAARRLTATFQNEPIDLVLKRIALTLGLRVERTDGAVFLLPNPR